MHKSDLPHDAGKLGPWHRINYALGESGRYEAVLGSGFEPVNVANGMAWEGFAARRAKGLVIGAPESKAFSRSSA